MSNILTEFDNVMQPYYDEYLLTMSTMAPSMQTLKLLLELCTNGSGVLDLGSGFSSFMLRYYADDIGLNICTVDDSKEWLSKTIGFCNNKLSNQKRHHSWHTLSCFCDYKVKFDVVFVDIGITKNRPGYYSKILRDYCDSQSFILFDDMHKPTLSQAVERELQHYTYIDIDVKQRTMDQYGRWCKLITRLRPKEVIS
jgi:hypothetical protein